MTIDRAQDIWLANLSGADAYTRWVLDEVGPWLRGRILEIGCGTGTYTVPLAEAGNELVAVDIDPAYVDVTAKRTANMPNVTVCRADADARDAALGEGFDCVVLFDVLEHIEHDAVFLSGLRHRLRPGGKLVLKVPANPALHSSLDDAIGHWRRYDRASLQTTFAKAGFRLEKLWSFNAFAVAGWWLNGKILKRTTPPAEQLRLFNTLIPVLRPLDRLFRHLGGLSYFAIGPRPIDEDPDNAANVQPGS